MAGAGNAPVPVHATPWNRRSGVSVMSNRDHENAHCCLSTGDLPRGSSADSHRAAIFPAWNPQSPVRMRRSETAKARGIAGISREPGFSAGPFVPMRPLLGGIPRCSLSSGTGKCAAMNTDSRGENRAPARLAPDYVGATASNVSLPTPLATDWDSENALWFQGVAVATPALQNVTRPSGGKVQ
jgi:hypothetical protein